MTATEIQDLKLESFINFKSEKAWKPLFKGRMYPTSPKLWASSKQRNKIYFKLAELDIDAYTAIFQIGGKKKRIFDLSCGDAWNILEALKRSKISEFISRN